MLRPASRGRAPWGCERDRWRSICWVPTAQRVDGYGELCQRWSCRGCEMRQRATRRWRGTSGSAPSRPGAPTGRSWTCGRALALSAAEPPLAGRPMTPAGLAGGRRGVRLAVAGRGGRARMRRHIADRYSSSGASTHASGDGRATRGRLSRHGARRHRTHAGDGHTGANGRGVPLGLEPMDLHAWFEAYAGGSGLAPRLKSSTGKSEVVDERLDRVPAGSVEGRAPTEDPADQDSAGNLGAGEAARDRPKSASVGGVGLAEARSIAAGAAAAAVRERGLNRGSATVGASASASSGDAARRSARPSSQPPARRRWMSF